MMTMHVREIQPDFEWKSTISDRIICGGTRFNDVQRYIRNNPQSWGMDSING